MLDFTTSEAYRSRPRGQVSARDEPDATQILDQRTIAEWREAICGCVPGSRGRFVLNEPKSVIGPLQSRKLRRGFSYPPYPEPHLNSGPAWPGRKTRIPGLLTHVCVRHPKRGACRRERGASRIPMAERTRMGSLWRRAVESAATDLFCNLLGRISRLNERWW